MMPGFGAPRKTGWKPDCAAAAGVVSVGGCDAYADAQAFTGVVVQAGNVDFAAVAVFHVVASNAALLGDRGDVAATGFRTFIRTIAAARHVVAHGATGHRADHRGGLAAITVTHGITE